MKFLSKLLTKKEEGPATITLEEHERLMLAYRLERDEAHARLNADNRALDKVAAHFKSQRDEARAEAAANAEDAMKYRRSRSNLKQFRDQKAVVNG